jgi:hypothetical protein
MAPLREEDIAPVREVIEETCCMTGCTFYKRVVIQTGRREMSKTMSLNDRVDILERCVMCRFFNRLSLQLIEG